MLVLTRKRDEAIKIGDEIIIRVIHTSKGSVKLGIEAPAHIRVLRAELTEFPAASPPSAIDSGEHDDPMLNAPMSATKFLREFDAEYVADLEDQLLVCTAS